MVVVPLVIGSLFTGIASLGDPRRLGRIGGRTLAYFLATTLAAAIVGLCVARAMPFGLVPTLAAGHVTPTSATPRLMEALLAIIPQNPFAAAAQGDLLPLIVAVCIFAAAATTLPGDKRQPVVEAFARTQRSVDDHHRLVHAARAVCGRGVDRGDGRQVWRGDAREPRDRSSSQ